MSTMSSLALKVNKSLDRNNSNFIKFELLKTCYLKYFDIVI